MTASYQVKSSAEDCQTIGYPSELTSDEYDRLDRSISVIETLWYVEECYDVLLQNAIELETAVGRQAACVRAKITSFPDEVDVEVRLINRLLINVLASARVFVDSIPASLSRAGNPLTLKLGMFQQLLSKQFDAEFSYRFMDALRNHTQHRAAAVFQMLAITRSWTHASGSGETMRQLSMVPQIDKSVLINDGKIRPATRLEIERSCGELIDLMPHINRYVQCFGFITNGTRAIYASEYDEAVANHRSILKNHLNDEWGAVWVTPYDDAERHRLLFTGAHNLRRLERIRLRNAASDPA